MEVFTTLRGNFKYPPVIKVDLTKCKIIDDFEIKINTKNIIDIKRGTNGLKIYKELLYVALWDRVIALNKNNMEIRNEFRSPYFSDLHGIDVVNENSIWVANTNMERIDCIKNAKACDSIWINEKLHSAPFNPSYNYNSLIKKDSPFHNFHINDVFVKDDIIIVSFLDDSTQKSWSNRLKNKVLKNNKLEKNGGLLFIDKKSKKVIKKIKNEGLHDLVFSENYILSTEYFGHKIIFIDIENKKITKKLSLQSPDLNQYLTRGVLKVEDGFWIGHTVKRGWESNNSVALIRHYDFYGEFSGREIQVPNSVGIYSFCLNE